MTLQLSFHRSHIYHLRVPSSRTLRATTVVLGVSLGGAAWNGVFVAGLIWLVSVGAGFAVPLFILVKATLVVTALAFAPIALLTAMAIYAWLAIDDRATAGRRHRNPAADAAAALRGTALPAGTPRL
ncbi:MAG: hypothetical protein ACRDGQ_02575 [Candidatus Limnocylindrales bacterium]